jgi:SAM-dependent methyltransferase
MKLHLGCGNDYKEGYINCDITNKVKVDKIVDLEKSLTMFKSNSVDEIVCNHTLEHINKFIPLMEELHRICKDNAIIKIKVPYFAYPGAFQDPTHVRFFTLQTFEYFSKESGLNYYSSARFNVLKKELNFSIKKRHLIIDFVINHNQRIYERLFSRLFPCAQLSIVLQVLK